MRIGNAPRSMKYLIILCVLVLFSNGLAQYSVGQTVPDFSLNDVHGNNHSLYDYQGKVILLNFFTTW